MGKLYIYIVQFLKPVYHYSALWKEAASFCDISSKTYQTKQCHKAENTNTWLFISPSGSSELECATTKKDIQKGAYQ